MNIFEIMYEKYIITKPIRLIELFGGIGAPRKALQRLGIEHEVVDYVEIDKYAVKSYNAIYGTNYEPQDITEWNKNLDVDLIFHGSPCQDFSLAGKQAGGEKDSGTRSSLLYETVRIVEREKPKYVIWENVKNVISKKHKHTFDNYLHEMELLGYTNYYQVLNAKDYGIPQNRERVFTISILGEHNTFNFPPKQELKLRLKDMLEDEIDEKYYLKTFDGFVDKKYKDFEDNRGYTPNMFNPYNKSEINDIAPTQSTQCGSTTSSATVLIKNDLRIRKLTPKECWRLMGFDDIDFEKAAQVNSNAQLYKQAGNSIVVNVLEAIFKELFKEE